MRDYVNDTIVKQRLSVHYQIEQFPAEKGRWKACLAAIVAALRRLIG
jgi:hypothetical protein